MTPRQGIGALPLIVVTAMLVPFAFSGHTLAQVGRPPAPIRAVIEGTWRLVEWHADDEVVVPPDMEGMWMVHDGHVMATRHRSQPTGLQAFESTAAYGVYRWGPMTWTYGYERSEDLRGTSAQEAELSVTRELPTMRSYRLTIEGGLLVLRDVRGVGLRWDYDLENDTFVLGPMNDDGELRRIIRKYRRVEE